MIRFIRNEGLFTLMQIFNVVHMVMLNVYTLKSRHALIVRCAFRGDDQFANSSSHHRASGLCAALPHDSDLPAVRSTNATPTNDAERRLDLDAVRAVFVCAVWSLGRIDANVV